MWGICLDIEGSLSQAVVQYEIADNGEVLITLPEIYPGIIRSSQIFLRRSGFSL